LLAHCWGDREGGRGGERRKRRGEKRAAIHTPRLSIISLAGFQKGERKKRPQKRADNLTAPVPIKSPVTEKKRGEKKKGGGIETERSRFLDV